MTFIDDLTLMIDLLVLVACAVFYTGVTVWFQLSRGDLARARSHLREGSILMGGLGGLLGLFALWGEFTWPLNIQVSGTNVLAGYDILFFDSLILLAFLLVGFSLAVNLRLPTHMVGMLGVFIGAAIFFYGYRAYTLSLTQVPLETLLMFLAFGGTAVLSYPATLFVDLYVVGPQNPEAAPFTDGPKPSYPMLWSAIAALFLVVVVLAGIAAIFYGYDAAWKHLASPP